VPKQFALSELAWLYPLIQYRLQLPISNSDAQFPPVDPGRPRWSLAVFSISDRRWQPTGSRAEPDRPGHQLAQSIFSLGAAF